MAFWEYTLTGFGDFLEQRSIAFTEPMSATRVCSTCGRVPSSSVLLACGHVLCEDCRCEVLGVMVCPFDGKASTEGQLVRHRFELSDLETLGVVCMVGGRKCATFAGKLCELRDHLRHCGGGDVKCAKCHQSIARDAAVDHYRQCCDGNAPRHSVIDVRVQRAVQEFRGFKEDLESLQQRASKEFESDDEFLLDTNGLVERLASLDRVLSEAQEMASGVDRETVPLQSSTKPPTPGPFRAASKPGVFIATCKFTNVFAARDTLTQTKKEYTVSSEVCTLSGYTFRLHCRFFFSGGEGSEEVNVKFMMCLQNGEWDDYLQWPFTKKVTFTIPHPRDETKDVRLTALVEGYTIAKKPRPGASNLGYWTEKKSWNDIEYEGFVTKDGFYMNVEFE
ncbi:hypothetical protein HPB49_024703 [Dermacentor silvarum]|uniref:Uncharacterized protein n=1 Tax=Dermacentor silvarum TaxID=543639 RepID=A0ACB8DRF2_DERSI|nr:uncharacterized protein LOC119431494 [Dermacentor silvarum]KAH7975164.1 hypothetical protein HPB49_024703 [Dermacentor silvarum]